MQKFKVTGIDARTNEIVGLDLEAPSVVEARLIAAERGLRHVAITHQPIPTEESPPPAEAGELPASGSPK